MGLCLELVSSHRVYVSYQSTNNGFIELEGETTAWTLWLQNVTEATQKKAVLFS